MSRNLSLGSAVAALALSPVAAFADGISAAGATKNAFDPIAVGMFFVLRADHARHHLLGGEAHDAPRRDFYAAGGGITGFQNGLAIAGDYMCAATLPRHRGARVRHRASTA